MSILDWFRVPQPKQETWAPRTYVKGRVHGTPSKYVSGCRCDSCRTSMNEYQRRWRASRRNRGTVQS